MSLDPLKTTKDVEESYLNYLSTTFHLRNDDLQDQFNKELKKEGKFLKGPILEATPPFKNGVIIEDLINEGILSPVFKRIRSEEKGGPLYDKECPLYVHQE